jgi:hypothetical protein
MFLFTQCHYDVNAVGKVPEIMPGGGLVQTSLVSLFLQHLGHCLAGDPSPHFDFATLPLRTEYGTWLIASKEKPIIQSRGRTDDVNAIPV